MIWITLWQFLGTRTKQKEFSIKNQDFELGYMNGIVWVVCLYLLRNHHKQRYDTWWVGWRIHLFSIAFWNSWMKGSVRSKLVSACFPSSELGENMYLRVGIGFWGFVNCFHWISGVYQKLPRRWFTIRSNFFQFRSWIFQLCVVLSFIWKARVKDLLPADSLPKGP